MVKIKVFSTKSVTDVTVTEPTLSSLKVSFKMCLFSRRIQANEICCFLMLIRIMQISCHFTKDEIKTYSRYSNYIIDLDRTPRDVSAFSTEAS